MAGVGAPGRIAHTNYLCVGWQSFRWIPNKKYTAWLKLTDGNTIGCIVKQQERLDKHNKISNVH